jgi:hypothetical protein
VRRVASALVLAALAAIVFAASLDTIRTTLAPSAPQAATRLRAVDGLTLLTGTLLWIDERCRLHVTSFPTLQEAQRPRRVGCDAHLLPGGRVAARPLAAPVGRQPTPPFVLGGDGWPRGVGLSLLDRIETLAVSPTGAMFAAATRGGIVLVKDGTPRTLEISDARALAWSPDERWLAAAGRKNVYVVRVLDRDMRIRRLSIAATDVAWISQKA